MSTSNRKRGRSRSLGQVAASASAKVASRRWPSSPPRLTDGHLGAPVEKAKKQAKNPCVENHENCPNSFLNKFLVPLLKLRDEDKLYDWLFQRNLFKTPDCCIYCSKDILHRQNALELWECEGCKQTFSIRLHSFFADLPHSIKDILSVVMAWSNKKTAQEAAQVLDMKMPIAQRIYQQCIDTIVNYVQNGHSKDWRLGGPGSVALLDLWPNGFIPVEGWKARELTKRGLNDRLRVLWIADTNHVPVRYVAHLLPPQKYLSEIILDFKRIEMEFGICPSSETNTDESIDECKSTEKIEEHESLSENTNSNTDSVVNQPQRREARVLREQQELAFSHEGGRFVKEDVNKKCSESSTNKRKSQDLEEENNTSSNSKNSKRKDKRRNKKSQVERALREAEKLEEKQHEEYIRDVALANDVVPVAREYIAPGSLVVVNDEVLPFVASSLQKLGKYECVTTVNNLISSGDDAIISILENIWKGATGLCSTLLSKRSYTGKPAVAEFQWRHAFGSSASEATYHILSHIATYYEPSQPTQPVKSKNTRSRR